MPRQRISEKIEADRIVEALVVVLLFYAATIRSLVIREYFPAQGSWIEAAIELFLLLVALWLLRKRAQLQSYGRLWSANWPLTAFIILAAASLIWTIDFGATLSRVLILIFSSMLAAYLAVRYQPEQILVVLAGFFAVMVFLCFMTAVAWPAAALINSYPYEGSWRAIFWHRNYLGSTMAFGNLLFLLCFLLHVAARKKLALFYAVFYCLALALVVLSRSATGLILILLLHAMLAAVLLWLRLYPRMRTVHYGVLLAVLAAAVALVYLKLDVVLGFFNRDANFTGRTGLWSYLLANYVNQRPLLGFGFGAFWQQPAFDLQLRDALGWPFAIVIGDNGYMDILLHLGVIGVALFAAVLALASRRIAKFAFGERTLLAFVPLLVMAYVLITNVTLSYFLETESFTWIAMIAMCFAATPVNVRRQI